MITWNIEQSHVGYAYRADRLIVIVVREDSKGRFVTMAVDSDLKRGFEDHGHALIGKFRSLVKAKAAAKKFVSAWKPGERCECPTIGATP